jgi:NTP pyrophosphatase (non-canonical NTP hydrolase)
MSAPHPTLQENPTLKDVQDYVQQVVRYRGFDKQSVQDELLMLCEEVGELAKAVRKHTGSVRIAADSKDANVRHETADVLWMLLCVCNRLGIDLETALREKEAHNKTRTWQ